MAIFALGQSAFENKRENGELDARTLLASVSVSVSPDSCAGALIPGWSPEICIARSGEVGEDA